MFTKAFKLCLPYKLLFLVVVILGWRKSTDFAILDLNRFTKNWISTDKFFFKCYKMEFNRFDVFWN